MMMMVVVVVVVVVMMMTIMTMTARVLLLFYRKNHQYGYLKGRAAIRTQRRRLRSASTASALVIAVIASFDDW